MTKLPKSRSLVDLTDIVANLYLSLQVKAIDDSLFDLSSGEGSYYMAPLDPLDLYQQPFQIEPFGLYLTTDRLVIHQQAVHETLQIQSVPRFKCVHPSRCMENGRSLTLTWGAGYVQRGFQDMLDHKKHDKAASCGS